MGIHRKAIVVILRKGSTIDGDIGGACKSQKEKIKLKRKSKEVFFLGKKFHTFFV